MANENFVVKIVADNLLKTHKIKLFLLQHGILFDKLLLEEILIAGISRATDIPEPWLQNYINKKYKQTLKKNKIVKKRSNDVIM